jgi:hypothetical protein|tara:strand:- start:175 stop:399 length:225 start_codon:yes stop_codon:yes gene_type:complete
MYSKKTIDKTLSCKSLTKKQKTDRLLEIDARQYTNLGTDSTTEEKATVKENSLYIYETIKKIDLRLGKTLLYNG